MARMRAQAWAAAALFGAAALAIPGAPGCRPGSDGIDRRAVSGSVTLDGKPLATGSITFNPTGPGPSAGGMITDGRYAIAAPEGPSPGPHLVSVFSLAKTGRKIPDSDGPRGSTVDEMTNLVPERYNLRTELKAVVEKEGPNQFDFELTSAKGGGGQKPAQRTGKAAQRTR
jgi:hypothetical protein